MLTMKRGLTSVGVLGAILLLVLSIPGISSVASADEVFENCSTTTQRNGYFDGKLLSAVDLKTEQVDLPDASHVETRNGYFNGSLLTSADLADEQLHIQQAALALADADCP